MFQQAGAFAGPFFCIGGIISCSVEMKFATEKKNFFFAEQVISITATTMTPMSSVTSVYGSQTCQESISTRRSVRIQSPDASWLVSLLYPHYPPSHLLQSPVSFFRAAQHHFFLLTYTLRSNYHPNLAPECDAPTFTQGASWNDGE